MIHMMYPYDQEHIERSIYKVKVKLERRLNEHSFYQITADHLQWQPLQRKVSYWHFNIKRLSLPHDVQWRTKVFNQIPNGVLLMQKCHLDLKKEWGCFVCVFSTSFGLHSSFFFLIWSIEELLAALAPSCHNQGGSRAAMESPVQTLFYWNLARRTHGRLFRNLREGAATHG